MAQTILVTTPVRVSFDIKRDASGLYFGYLKEYPGIISQGRTRNVVQRRLVRLLREIGRNHPEELQLFR